MRLNVQSPTREETNHNDRMRKSEGESSPTNDMTPRILAEMNKTREDSREGYSCTLAMNGQGLLLVYKDNRIIAEKFFYDVLPSKVEVWTRDEGNNWILALCAQELLPLTVSQSNVEPNLASKPPASETPIDLSLVKPSTVIDFELSPITWPSFEELCKTPPPLLGAPPAKKKRIRKRKDPSSGKQPEWKVLKPSEGTTLLQPRK